MPMVEEATIETLGAQGDGVTGAGVYIPQTLPGERVAFTPAGHRGRLESVLAASEARIEPVCRHFGTCGGCSMQHAEDALIAGWKRTLVISALASRGIEGVEVRETVTSPPASRRRVTVTGTRTRKGSTLGFHEQGSDRIVDVEECAVADPAIVAVLPKLKELIQHGASRKGELRLTVTATPAGLDVAVTGGKPVEGPLYGQLVAVAAIADLARLTWNGETVVARRPPGLQMGRVLVVPPPGGFLQATAHGEAALAKAVAEAVGDAALTLDLFAGCGTFALRLAEKSEVLAIDSEADAMAALDKAWRGAEGLKRIETEARDLFRRPLLARQMTGIDAAVMDPPRQGARSQAEELARSEIARIAMVSCNPATFARDARTLIDGGYRLAWVQPVDQFRWSPHVELAAAFERT